MVLAVSAAAGRKICFYVLSQRKQRRDKRNAKIATIKTDRSLREGLIETLLREKQQML
jgi:hypothetical protein